MTHIRSRLAQVRPAPGADRTRSALAIAAMLAMAGSAVHAQGAAPAAPAASAAARADEAQTVVVTGVRASVETAQALKKNSDKISDSIVADDIGKFPDADVADALARVTGIQITRDSGEASHVLIRGLSQVETLLNGREVFTTTGRYINLADIPVTMISRVDVFKTPTSDLPEGGIAGIIDVRTRRPFDFKGLEVDVQAKDTYADKADHADPNLSGLVSNRWETPIGEIGALLGLSAMRRHYHEERAFDTQPIDKSWLLPDLTGPDVVGLESINGKRQRTSGNLALEWKPNALTGVYLEGLKTRDVTTYGTAYFVGLPWWGDGALMSGTKIPGTDQLQTITSHNVNTIMSTQANWFDSKTSQYALGGHFDASDEVRISGELTTTSSTYDWRNPILDTITNVPNAYVNTNQNGTLHLEYTGIDLNDESNYYLKGFFDRYGQDKGHANEAHADVVYTPSNDGWLHEWANGMRLARRQATSIKSFEGNAEAPDVNTSLSFPYSRQSMTTLPGLDCTAQMSGGGPDYGVTSWYTPCTSTLLDNTAMIRQAVTGTTAARALDPGSFFKDDENTLALYSSAKIGFKLGNLPVDATVGGRLVYTKQDLIGYDSSTSANIDKSSSQTDFLPNVNVRFNFTPELIGRLAAGKTMTRPNFSDLNPGVALVSQSETVQATGSGGNAKLKSMSAKNYESALEWYFSRSGSVTATLFDHEFKGYITTQKADEVYNGVTYSVTRPYNTSTGNLRGIELAYQQFYDGLPSFLSGFGTSINATIMKGTQNDNSGTSRPITGVSKFSYNVAALYEKYGFSGRLAYNWRSKFTDSYDNGGPGYDLIVAPIGQLDGTFSYKFTNKFSVILEGTNLLDNTYRDYWNQKNIYPRDTRRYDRTGTIGFSWSL